MWVFTPQGFISAVQHREDNNIIIVRARDRESLTFIADQSSTGAKIEHSEMSDYAYRVEITRDDFREWLSLEVTLIDYDNFKNEAARQRGPKSRYVTALHDIWMIMFRYQGVITPRKRRNKTAGVAHRGVVFEDHV